MESILVFGAGGHVKVVIDIIEKLGTFKIEGIVDKKKSTEPFLTYPVIGEDEIVALNVKKGLVAILDNWSRAKTVNHIKELIPDFAFIKAIHPSAEIAAHIEIGDGTVVMPGVVINSGVHIGQHCIVNTRAAIDHDCTLKDFSSVSAGAILGGQVTVGTNASVSMGAILMPGTGVGDHSEIGAGSVVVKTIPDNVLAFGTPCKVVRMREPGRSYA